GTSGFLTGGWRMDFVKNGDEYVLEVCKDQTDVAEYVSTPVRLYIKGASKSLLSGYTETEINSGYDTVEKKSYGYLCTAEVQTENGSKILVRDSYYLKNGEFVIDRSVSAVEKSAKDKGIASAFTVACASGGDYDYFVPSILYKDSDYMSESAIFANTSISSMYVMETRTGLPLAMLYSGEQADSVAISHYNPQISGGKTGGGANGDVDNGLQYGSVGYERDESGAVGFRYPCAEGPVTYNGTQGWTKLYHEISPGKSTRYAVSLIFTECGNYNDSMEETYRRAYLLEDPDIIDEVNMEDILEYNLFMFEDTYKEFNNGTSAGVPWSMDLVDKDYNTPYSFQMGFVGQQTSVGAQLLRSGYESASAKRLDMGTTILNFWTSNRIFANGNVLPYVWWYPAENSSGGSASDYTAYLRAFVDGCEGILDGYMIAKKYGDVHTDWLNAVLKVADFLCANQNPDGSFYRAYNRDGSVNTNTVDKTVQGTSKVNTPVAVKFLLRIYELTGNEKYMTSAIRAADYSYEKIYNGICKYVGGTIDHNNIVDREASIYALYCFESAYSASGDEKYLTAAKHAAVSALSWVYVYDFKVPNDRKNEAYNPFRNGGVSGFSMIATGESGADNFAAYLYYVFYRMYVHTGEEFYFKASELLQNNTKSSSDYKGELGYAYRAISTEATLVANFNYYSVNAWLPWSSIANIDPITKMKDTFGVASVYDVSGTAEEQRSQINAYGVGGKIK
ncbi:MAG: hypothetical protein ACI4S9_03240, partial [Christensenellales bacterium]